MRILVPILLILLLASPSYGFHRAKAVMPHTRLLTAEHVFDAARIHNVPSAALFGILATEGGRMGEALSNKNGTWDMGCFQINTVHIRELGAIGLSPQDIMCDGKVNAYAAAWILRKEYRRTGDLWQAIGAYHSRTPHFRDAYIGRVKSNIKRLKERGLTSLPLVFGSDQ